MAAKWQKTLDDLLYNGDLDGAYNLLDGILRDNPNDIDARVAFGRVQYELGDPDNARNTFETVIKRNPKKYLNINKLDKNLNRGIADFISGMTDRYAINLYKNIK